MHKTLSKTPKLMQIRYCWIHKLLHLCRVNLIGKSFQCVCTVVDEFIATEFNLYQPIFSILCTETTKNFPFRALRCCKIKKTPLTVFKQSIGYCDKIFFLTFNFQRYQHNTATPGVHFPSVADDILLNI